MTSADWIAVVGLALTLLIAASGAFGYLLKENRSVKRETESSLGVVRKDFETKLNELRRDLNDVITQALNKLDTRLISIDTELRGQSTQMTALLRDHYLPIRDFSRHESDQRDDIRDLKTGQQTTHSSIDELRNLIIESLKQ